MMENAAGSGQGARPRELIVIAGRGIYPLELAQGARREGVEKLVAIAFRWETAREIEQLVDQTVWLKLGRLGDLLDALRTLGIRHAVMAGQIKPTRLFSIRPDRLFIELLGRLPVKNAHTIYGAVASEIERVGVSLLPAYQFMESAMPAAGLLTSRKPTEAEWQDIRLGCRVAKLTSGLDIGQTVVIKGGVILAIEAFEGTDQTIHRAGRLGGAGAVVVKVAKRGHDMRFDIPVIGRQTLRVLRKVRAAVMALEAGRTILLERDRVVEEADAMGLSLIAVDIEREGMNDERA